MAAASSSEAPNGNNDGVSRRKVLEDIGMSVLGVGATVTGLDQLLSAIMSPLRAAEVPSDSELNALMVKAYQSMTPDVREQLRPLGRNRQANEAFLSAYNAQIAEMGNDARYQNSRMMMLGDEERFVAGFLAKFIARVPMDQADERYIAAELLIRRLCQATARF